MEEEDVSGDVEDDFEEFQAAFDELRAKFGVPLGGGGGGGRFGGGGGGGGDNALGSVAGIAGEISSFWETPSDALVARYYAANASLSAAMEEVGPFMERARALSAALAEDGVTMEVPGRM
jgi:hypothetical protein